MIATDFYVDPSGMLDPTRRVNTRIANLLAQLANAPVALLRLPKLPSTDDRRPRS